MNQLLDSTTQQGVWLEISRGKSKFRSRPVHEGRFLIGAGSTCHLQLGGHDIPMLHSVIESNNDELTIDAVVAHPPLIVNGQHRRAACLFDGDIVEIGAFEFRICRPVESIAADTAAAGVDTEFDLGSDQVHEDLSAAELVARIEELEEMERDLEQSREDGAAALLQAVRTASRSSVSVAEGDARYEEIVKTLSLLSEQVVSQAQLFAEREQAWQQALLSMQDTQQRIIHQLANLAQATELERQSVGTRASA